MAIFSIIAIGAALLAGGASYVQAKKAQKKAKKLANSMAGVLLNKESNIEPLPVIYGTRRVGGVRVFISTEGATNEYLYIALALCEGPVASIASIEIDGIPITDSRFSSTVATQLHYGTDDQVRSALLAGASGWTTDHRLRGVAYISVRLKWDQDVFSGIPEITALVTGKRVYDPRTGNTVWSANPALCIRDYLTNTRYGKGLPDSAIDDVAFSAAADDCDSFTVTPYSGATSGIDLFQCNAVIDTGEEIFRNVEKMLLGCRGFLPYIGGKYGLYIDQSKSPILDLGLDNIIGSISFAGERKEDKFNRVIVKFANPNTEWQEDAAIWPDAGSTEETTYLSEDGGVLLVDEIDMETITNYYAARDFARIFVLRSRNGMRVSLQATSEAMNLIVGDVIRLTHPTPSFTNKPFQVEQVSLNYDGTVNLDLLEYDSTIYSYDPASEETSYPDTNLPDPFVVGEPTGLTLTESTRVENDGTIIPAVLVQWSAPVDYFVNAYEVQYKLSTDSTYKSLITWSTEFDLTLPQSGVTYDIRVRSINAVGARSANISDQIAIVGDNVAPGVPTNASVAADTHLLIVTWDNPSDSDFSYTEIKRSPNATEANAVVIAKINGEAYTDGPFAVGTTYYYWLRAVDRTGNASEWVSAGNDTTVALAAGDLEGDLVNTGLYRGIVTDDANAPSNAEFSSVAGRNPRDGDLAITIDTTADPDPDVYYAWEYDGDSWDSIPNLISGDLLVDGSVSASKIDVTGVITAGSLITESATISNDIQIGSGESVFKADSNGIYLGNETFANAEFRVTPAGAVTATSATISGAITATSLTLNAGVEIGAGNIAYDDVTLTNSGGNLVIKGGGVDTIQLADEAVTGTKIDVSSYIKAGSGANAAVMSGRPIDNFAFWAGAGFATDGGPSGGNAPFRVTRAGKVVMTSFALYSSAGTKLFDSEEGLLAFPQTTVAQSSGTLVDLVSEELTSGTDTFTVTLSSTQTITANFAYPVGTLFWSGTSIADSLSKISTAFTVTLQYSSNGGSSWNTFGSAQSFSRVISGTPTSSQFLVIGNEYNIGPIIPGEPDSTIYFAALQDDQGAIDEGFTLLGSTSQSLAAGTYLIRMAFSATGGTGTGAPATDKTREVRLTTSGTGFTVSNTTVSDVVAGAATTTWVTDNFVAKDSGGNATVTGALSAQYFTSFGGQELILTAGESKGQLEGVTGGNPLQNEYVYAVAESGLQIISSPNNWIDGGNSYNDVTWASRNTATICKTDGRSDFPAQINVTSHGNSSEWNTAYGWGNHADAGYLTGNQTITLTGDATGSGTTSIAVTVANDSHTHDTRYFTETESDNRFHPIGSPVFSGDSSTADDITSRIESGFYETSTPSTGEGYPAGVGDSWAHLLSITHSNNSNYYALQLSASFFTQNLYYRSTNNSGATAWSRIWTDTNDGSGSGLDADTVDGVEAASFLRSDADDNFSGKLTATGTATNTALDLATNDQYASMRVIRNSGSSTNDGMYIGYGNAGTGVTRIYGGGSTSSKVQVSSDGSLTADGNVTAYSDERLKTDIATLDGSKVFEMRGVSFTKDGKKGSGVIAQELEKVAPELVMDGEFKSVAYGNLVGYLIEAIKELKAEVDDLKTQLEKGTHGNH